MNSFLSFLPLCGIIAVVCLPHSSAQIHKYKHLVSDSGLKYSFSSDVIIRANDIIPPEAREEYPFYVTTSIRKLHNDLFRDVFKVVLDEGVFFNGNKTRAESPFQFKTKQEIRKIINFTLPQTRESHESLLKTVRDLIKYSPHASHPFKVDRHGAGLDPYGLVGDWIGTTMSVPVLTYLIAPVFTLMEYEVQKRIRLLVYGSETGDGIVTHGAGLGKGFAIQIALQKKFENLKEKGFVGSQSPTAVFFVSDQASFSYEKYAIWEGIGSNAVIRVATDNAGRMNTTELEKKILEAKSQKKTPFMVVGTAGTPILGAIDPLEQIGKISKKYDMWFHVDGRHAGATFLSEKQKPRIKGAELSDSFFWSADKSLSAPVVTTILVTKEEGIVNKTFSFGAAVIFGNSSIYNKSRWDNGDSTLQTTRRPDILKIWFMWKSKGQQKLAQHVDYTYDLTKYAVTELKKRSPAFTPILQQFDSNQIAFSYTPSSIRSLPRAMQDPILASSKFTERLKVDLLRNGVMSISVNSLPDSESRKFFVMSLANSALTEADVNYLFDQIEAYGEKILFPKSLVDGTMELKAYDPENSGKFLPRFFTLPEKPTILPTIPTTKSPAKKIVVPPAPAKLPDFVSAPVESMHRQYLTDFFKTVLDNGTFFEESRRSEPALLYKSPEQLLAAFDFSLSNSTGTMLSSEEDLLEIFKKIIKYSGHMAHPYYDFQLTQGLDPYTMMADYIIGAINSPMITYEDNPIFTVMEEELTKAVRKQVGYPEDGEGIILPGGSFGNQIAVLMATIVKRPEAKAGGTVAVKKPMVVFLSVGAHYSTNKAAFFGGLGTDNAVFVDQDERGRMSVEDLKKKVQAELKADKIPFIVVATAGTTVLGAFDPINDIADVCKEYGMWLHVDASYGGSSILSSNSTRKSVQFKGVERSDSFTFNPHKALASTQEISVTVIKQKGTLEKVAPPASKQESNNEILYNGKQDDPSVTHLFPDRRANVFKLWFLWKAKGLEGLGQHIDYGYNLTQQVTEYIQSKQNAFILAHSNYPPECTNVNFYYVPKRLRDREDRNSIEFWKAIEPIQRQIVKSVILNNRIVIADESVGHLPAYLILSLYNSALTFADVKYMLDIIDHYGQEW